MVNDQDVKDADHNDIIDPDSPIGKGIAALIIDSGLNTSQEPLLSKIYDQW